MEGISFPDSPSLRRITNRHTKDTLIDLALKWIDVHTITRIESSQDEDEDDNMMDTDSEVPVHKLSLSNYKEHLKKLYEDMREKSNKKAIVDRMLNVDWSTGLNSSQIADLDLAYYSQHSSLKNWKAFKLDYGDQGAHNILIIDWYLRNI
ncbi:hypothetical protein BGZ49_007060 [Haplosporangium sp. Z 27]|nr:hypothetical protein BGZ49_007060 [Haplosporangium sp. Z 27]